MKRLLTALVFISLLVGCNNGNTSSKPSVDTSSPYKEYSVNDTKVAEIVETHILKAEAEKYGFDLKTSSAHMVSFKKVGSYGSGDLKIIAFLNAKGTEAAEDKGYINVNRIVSYTCKFEYSYKTEKYVWTSDYPYASTSTLF